MGPSAPLELSQLRTELRVAKLKVLYSIKGTLSPSRWIYQNIKYNQRENVLLCFVLNCNLNVKLKFTLTFSSNISFDLDNLDHYDPWIRISISTLNQQQIMRRFNPSFLLEFKNSLQYYLMVLLELTRLQNHTNTHD